MARGSFGIQLQVGNGAASEVFTNVLGLQDLSIGQTALVMEEVTSHDSPGGWREMIPNGVREAGDVTFSVNVERNDPGQALLNRWHEQQTMANFRIVAPGRPNRLEFRGFVSAIGEEAPVRGVQRRSYTITRTGPAVEVPNT